MSSNQNVRRIEQQYMIGAPISKVWEAFINPDLIEQWGGGPAVIDDQEGTRFSLWGGDVTGINIEVIPKKLLVQDWYGRDWAEPSRLTINFESMAGETIIKLVHENVPEKEIKDISSGWKDYYIGPLKELVEKQ